MSDMEIDEIDKIKESLDKVLGIISKMDDDMTTLTRRLDIDCDGSGAVVASGRTEAADGCGSGNAQTMRNALAFAEKELMDAVCDNDFGDDAAYLSGCMKTVAEKCRKALAAPARNCDVGTAEEQVERFKEYCQSNMQYYPDMFGTHEGAGGWDCREDCPIGKMVDKNDSFCDHCELLWAQMPYEEGGEK